MSDPEHDDGPEETLLEFIARRRREPPRRGEPPYKTAAEIADEQGVGPIDLNRLRAIAQGTYEGFEEDVCRMRHGLPPLGPRA